jgi:hypothetical protein
MAGLLPEAEGNIRQKMAHLQLDLATEQVQAVAGPAAGSLQTSPLSAARRTGPSALEPQKQQKVCCFCGNVPENMEEWMQTS